MIPAACRARSGVSRAASSRPGASFRSHPILCLAIDTSVIFETRVAGHGDGMRPPQACATIIFREQLPVSGA
jgi:hypothetical protein